MYMNRGNTLFAVALSTFFSFASEYPYRIDFFGDEVESIRTFEVESQLSREKKSGVSIVPDLAVTGDVTTSFSGFYPERYYSGNARFSLVA